MIRSLLALVACVAFVSVSVAVDKDLAAAKAKAKAKACALLAIEQSQRAVPPVVEPSAKLEIEVPAHVRAPTVPRERFVVVSAAWCTPCQLMKSRELPTLRTAFDVEEVDGDVVKTHAVSSYPTVIFERDGREVWRVAGYTSAETLKALAAGK